MRRALTLLMMLGWLSGAGAAERLVTGDRVNLRADPGTDAGVLARLDRDARLEVLGEHGDWYQVRTTGRGKDFQPVAGWVHGSLLSSPAYAEFRKVFDYRNRRAKELTGETFFSRVADRGAGVVEIVATPVWLAQPEEGRQDNLRFIAGVWSQVQPPERKGEALTVIVRDDQGQERMRMQTRAGEEPVDG